ncbi:ubiquinone biosynthesis accessory factor UbiJ [Coxiella endosymbiont of Amblyomma nuttalli]|uniref:ubiquinone biosynthesis accessory factor UbiJ n=1 Tax=Coxiella endosymbiont of Amblyomma nuttalli TaxID=2749996 RepID=UPI001BA4DABB|nr:SCP2 sterol-binding domain-containing protein [Coxiella endosymbiont of Amblyomma nuttalli]QTS83605.1 SCP-2 sterol transfer family protein [Coxiella endosymbiont of Amblyomma nuttalli]
MLTLVLSGLEKVLNTCLQLDPASTKRLSSVENKIIKIEFTDWKLSFFILPSQSKIRLLTVCNNKPDTIITGTFFGLFKIGYAKYKGSALSEHAVEISGNTNIGEEIRDILLNIDIDWEECLSKITGDIIAHKISVVIHRAKDISKFVTETFYKNIKDYLQIEARFTPTAEEVDFFMQSFNHLQYNVKRTEARINRLLAKRKISI